MNQQRTPCPFKIHKWCPFGFTINDLKSNADLIKIYCGMCVKSSYALAKIKLVNRFSVVNTL